MAETPKLSLFKILPPMPSTERGRNLHIHEQGNKLVYGSGNTAIILNLNDPTNCDLYTGHNSRVTCVKIAPNGNYAASGDVSGNLKVWAITHPDKIVKYEVKMFTGPVKDIAWNPDSDRIAVCGESSTKFANVIMWDSGNTVGEITGHSKTIMSIDFKPTRPFRVVTASEDFTVNYYEGPPFKFKESGKLHENYANCVRFSPDGARYVSVGSDRKVVLYDSATGEPIGPIESPDAHSGSIMSVSWMADSQRFVTASLDKTVKVWDGSQVLASLAVDGSSVDHQ
jgi:WD40 repeat protein